MQFYRYLSLTITAAIVCSCSALAAQSQPPEVFTHPPSPSPGHYKPPPLSRMSDMDDHDPAMQKVNARLLAGDLPGYKAELQKQAEAGSPYAQLTLGALYIPSEKYAPPDFSHAFTGHEEPKIVPDTSSTLVTKLFPPSFAEALKWLTQASAQGSGEASELIAQIITRQLDSHLPTPTSQRTLKSTTSLPSGKATTSKTPLSGASVSPMTRQPSPAMTAAYPAPARRKTNCSRSMRPASLAPYSQTAAHPVA